ncbi:MAG: DNA replication/repair protein RecF [Thermoleophilia bacterium]
MTILHRVRLQNVRNQESLALAFEPGVNVLAGPNGVGKTSVLEAVHTGLRGWSPRTRSLREMIHRGSSVMRVELELETPSGFVVAATGYDREGLRRTTRAGAPVEGYERWEEEFPVRVFLPDHLLMVKGGPRRRRRWVDELAAALRPAHRAVAGEYENALRQRNTLLRRGIVGAEHRVWEAVLAGRGLELVQSRRETLAAFSPRYAAAFRMLAGSSECGREGDRAEASAHESRPEAEGEARLVYRTNVAELAGEAYRDRLAEERGDDRRRGYTRLGPHRDDVRFFLGERDLREYGSQGEQRTALLAVLLAEREWIHEKMGVWPLLLLDDVMSELDADRRGALLEVLRRGGQSIITTTTTEYFPSAELGRLNLVRLEFGSSEVHGSRAEGGVDLDG